MIFGLFRSSPNRPLIERLHGEIMAAARQPALFETYAIADTVEGRFEALALIASLVLRALMRLPPPGRDLAQDVTDEIFHGLDVALREIGVSDTSLARRMKTMAQGFLGRAEAYRSALDADDDAALTQAIARNVYGGGPDHAAALAAYARRCEGALAGVGVAAYLSGPLPIPAAGPSAPEADR